MLRTRAYAPPVSPIERAFSKVKALLSRLEARTREALVEAADQPVSCISRADTTAWASSTDHAFPAPAS